MARNQTPEEFFADVKDALGDLYDAHDRLNKLWSEEPEGIDLNDFLAQEYPFKESFDELFLGVIQWEHDGRQRIDEFLKSKQNKDNEHNTLQPS